MNTREFLKTKLLEKSASDTPPSVPTEAKASLTEKLTSGLKKHRAIAGAVGGAALGAGVYAGYNKLKKDFGNSEKTAAGIPGLGAGAHGAGAAAHGAGAVPAHAATGPLSSAPSRAKMIMDNVAVLGLSGLALTGGAAGASAIGSAVADPIKREHGFSKTVDENPWIKDLEPEKQTFLRKSYDTLFRFSPTMAMDPLVSGSFLMKQEQMGPGYGLQNPSDLQTISNIENAVRDRQSKNMLMTAFSPAMTSNLATSAAKSNEMFTPNPPPRGP